MSDNAQKQSWWQRLSGGLKRTSSSIGGAISDLVSKRKLDGAMLEELEEMLIRADLGVDVAAKIAAAIGEGRYDKTVTPDCHPRRGGGEGFGAGGEAARH